MDFDEDEDIDEDDEDDYVERDLRGWSIGKDLDCTNPKRDSLDDFRCAQATKSTFFPPYKDVLGWGTEKNFALYDYVARWDTNAKRRNFETMVRGKVQVLPRKGKGRKLITVAIRTKHAPGFYTEYEGDNWPGDVLIGAFPRDIDMRKKSKKYHPAFCGFTKLRISYYRNKGVTGHPDLVDLVGNREKGVPGFKYIKLTLQAKK